MNPEDAGGTPSSPKVRRLRRDRNAEIQMSYVPVPTPQDLPPPIGCGLAQALIKHILFIRQQIPMPYDQLRSQIKAQEDEQHRSRRPNTYARKVRKLVEATDSVLEGVNTLITRARVLGMLVSLGPTPINPKEAFILRFNANGNPILPESKLVKDPSRQMIRQLVTSGLEQFDKPALPQKLFVLALVADGPAQSNDSDMSNADETGSAHWAGGWVPRHGFAPKLRKCTPVGISVGAPPFCEDPFPSVLTGQQPEGGVRGGGEVGPPLADFEGMRVAGGPGMVWLQHTAVVRGLPHDSQGM